MFQHDLDSLFTDLIFFRNAFDAQSVFTPTVTKKEVGYPLNMKYDDNGFVIEIAAIGVDRKDVEITVQNDVLSVEYKKPEEKEESYTYKYRGITNKSFRFDWKISSQLDIESVKPKLEGGLLTLYIPIKPESKAKKIAI